MPLAYKYTKDALYPFCRFTSFIISDFLIRHTLLTRLTEKGMAYFLFSHRLLSEKKSSSVVDALRLSTLLFFKISTNYCMMDARRKHSWGESGSASTNWAGVLKKRQCQVRPGQEI